MQGTAISLPQVRQRSLLAFRSMPPWATARPRRFDPCKDSSPGQEQGLRPLQLHSLPVRPSMRPWAIVRRPPNLSRLCLRSNRLRELRRLDRRLRRRPVRQNMPLWDIAHPQLQQRCRQRLLERPQLLLQLQRVRPLVRPSMRRWVTAHPRRPRLSQCPPPKPSLHQLRLPVRPSMRRWGTARPRRHRLGQWAAPRPSLRQLRRPVRLSMQPWVTARRVQPKARVNPVLRSRAPTFRPETRRRRLYPPRMQRTHSTAERPWTWGVTTSKSFMATRSSSRS